MRIVTVISFLLLTMCAFGQHPNKFIYEGNTSYEDGDYEQSVSKYKESLAIDPDNYTAAFNLGDAFYRQEKFAEAAQQFSMLAERAKTNDQKSKAYHNLGNSLLAQGNFKESIDAYKNALINDPADSKARYNLTYAKKMLQQQQQQQQQDGEDNEENQNDEGEDNEDESPEDQTENPDDYGENNDENENPEDEPQDNNQNDNEQDPNDPEKNPQQPQNNEVSKENAEKMLDALNDLERSDHEKMRKEKGDARAMGILKDW